MSRLCCNCGERMCCSARFCVCCIPCPATRRVYWHGRRRASNSANSFSCQPEFSRTRIHGLLLSVYHYPIDRAVELQNLLERTVPFIASNRYEIGAKAAPNPSKRVFL